MTFLLGIEKADMEHLKIFGYSMGSRYGNHFFTESSSSVMSVRLPVITRFQCRKIAIFNIFAILTPIIFIMIDI